MSASAIVPLATYPPSTIKSKFSTVQWQSLVDSWSFLAQKLLSASDDVFPSLAHEARLIPFLISYVQNQKYGGPRQKFAVSDGELDRRSFLLLHRTLSSLHALPEELLAPTFLAQAIRWYGLSGLLKDVLRQSWTRHELHSHKCYIKFKGDLVALLESKAPSGHLHDVVKDSILLSKAIAPFSKFFMTGSDSTDALSEAYVQFKDYRDARRQTLALLHACLLSFLDSQQSSSFLVDQLYHLQSTALLQDLVRKTSFYAEFEKYISSLPSAAEREKTVLSALAPYRREHRPNQKFQRADKGKGREVNASEDEVRTIEQAHQLSLVSQVQDLFPHLGAGFVIKLLDAYRNDTEEITALLLDDKLPDHLRSLDQAETLEELPHPAKRTVQNEIPAQQPKAAKTNVPERRNIFDNDDFDRLSIDPSRLHKGRKNAGVTADEILSREKPISQKEAIFSALAAFDSDDDERDDTYDTADVGGSIDNTLEQSSVRDRVEETLFSAFKRNVDLFSRISETRRSKDRAALREQTNMTDEAIEGWAIMLQRDPKRLRHLETEYNIGAGLQQQSLASSAWKADSDADTADEGSTRVSGQGRGFGRGRGGGRGRGTPSGPTSDHSTQVARQRKDANKGSRANHNRRDQRARKVARAGGLVG